MKLLDLLLKHKINIKQIKYKQGKKGIKNYHCCYIFKNGLNECQGT